MKPTVYVMSPEVPSQGLALTKDDVWGVNLEDRGMIVARQKEVCPIWGDLLPSKTSTFVCLSEQIDQVIYWIGFVYGADCNLKTKELDDSKVAIRAEYTCW